MGGSISLKHVRCMRIWITQHICFMVNAFRKGATSWCNICYNRLYL